MFAYSNLHNSAFMTGFHVDPGPRLVRIPGGVEPDPGPDGPGRQGVGQDVP